MPQKLNLGEILRGEPGVNCQPRNRRSREEGLAMADTNTTGDAPQEERIPAFQHLLDNPFLLLFFGVAIPTIFYILWGVMEILTLPSAP